MRAECEAAVVGEQGGEGDQVRPVAGPVLLEHVAGGGEGDGGAGAARAAGAPAGVVGAGQAVQSASGVRPAALAKCERQGDGLERLGRRQAHEGAAAAAPSAAPPPSAQQQDLLPALAR